MERLALKPSLRLLFSPYQQASNARWIYSDIEIVSVNPFSGSKLEMDGGWCVQATRSRGSKRGLVISE